MGELVARESRRTLAERERVGGGLKIAGKTLFGKVRNKYFTRRGRPGQKVKYDEFVLECFSPESERFRLVLEYFDREVKARHSFEILPGWNRHALSTELLHFGSAPPAGKITLYPENDAERRLIFTWLDLVQYRTKPGPPKRSGSGQNSNQVSDAKTSAPSRPAAKVKCIAWDLDNTLWHGILAEDTQARLKLRGKRSNC